MTALARGARAATRTEGQAVGLGERERLLDAQPSTQRRP
jgi:hypothetical protein